MIRAIFFDLDHTLIDIGPAWVLCIADYLSQHFPECPPDRRTAFLQQVAERTPVWDGYQVVFARKLARNFPEIGRSIPTIATELAARLPRHMEPDADVISLLYDLAGRYTTAIISNGSSRVQRGKLDRSNLAQATGRVFISGELGMRKPDAGLFRVAMAWARVEPEAALMVGDHIIEDIWGAKRVGMQTCFVGHDMTFPEAFKTTLRINRVTDLPGVLG